MNRFNAEFCSFQDNLVFKFDKRLAWLFSQCKSVHFTLVFFSHDVYDLKRRESNNNNSNAMPSSLEIVC